MEIRRGVRLGRLALLANYVVVIMVYVYRNQSIFQELEDKGDLCFDLQTVLKVRSKYGHFSVDSNHVHS